MNRLILIGNGFDLAHGMRTKYEDFIAYLWKCIFEDLYAKSCSNICSSEFVDKNQLLSLRYTAIADYGNKRVRIVSNSVEQRLSLPNTSSDSIELLISQLSKLRHKYENSFFKLISNRYLDKRWSDIESDYYRELKKIKDDSSKVKKLNEGFRQIRELLKLYLKSLDKPEIIDDVKKIIFSPIAVKDLRLDSISLMKSELLTKVAKLIRKDEHRERLLQYVSYHASADRKNNQDELEYIVEALMKAKILHDEIKDFFYPDNILLLNFNYTTTDAVYSYYPERDNVMNREINIHSNHIHGTLDEKNNYMIFGYGDEDDENYKELENSEIQGLLDNVKSINYLESSNYRQMEEFIESDNYQIFIMGMSCGMADRTMLRKLFEHKNCVSVKPFYYEYSAGDNYVEIVQNISRCFSNKDLLRSTVVSKPNCERLPQYSDKKKEKYFLFLLFAL